jgi:hypothetical protein
MSTHYDLSTLDAAALASLPLLGELRPGYRLQDNPGNGCAGDPPGFPTYFTRSVYTQMGNNPSHGPTTVIDAGHGTHRIVSTADEWRKGDTWDTVHARHTALMRRLYAPLPFDHPRVRAWVAATHQHLRSCYLDDTGAAEPLDHGRPVTIVFPVPSYKLRTFHDDPRFSNEWRAKERAAVDQQNTDKIAAYTRVATLDNHQAVRAIREIYPAYNPTSEEITALEAAPRPGDWWERHATRPTPAECQPGGFLREHRADDWCQFCGSVDGVQP